MQLPVAKNQDINIFTKEITIKIMFKTYVSSMHKY
jgi:hypothetical protein